MATKIKGYDLRFLLNAKKCLGATNGSFKITPKVKTSLIKDDAGVEQAEVDGYNSEFSLSGVVMKNGVAETDQLDLTDLRAAVKAGTPIPFVYGGTSAGSATESGNMIITDYSEDSDSENYATYSLSCRVVGNLTPGTVS